MLCLILVTVVTATAQTSQVLYFMDLPQRTTLNPAMKPTGRTYVALPGISDISLRVDNNFLSLSDLFEDGLISESSLTLLEGGPGVERFLDRLGSYNYADVRAGVKYLGVAWTIMDDLRLSLDISARADIGIGFPGEFMRFAVRGNQDYMGQPLDFSSLRSEVRLYHEIAIGASRSITEQLRVGARALLLSGVASASLRNNGMTLTVNSDNTHTAVADVALRISAPLSYIIEEDGAVHGIERDRSRLNSGSDLAGYMLPFSNPGLGIDLGAEYRFSDMFALSAALTNLGFIRWKRDRTDLSINSTFEFNGLTLKDVYDDNVEFDDFLNWAIDSLQNVIELNESPGASTTFLPALFSAAFSYTPVSFFTAGVLSQTRFEGKRVHQSVTLSGNVSLGSTFGATMAYTLANRRYDNLGLGLTVRGGIVQYFLIVDNIPLRWTRVTSGGSSFRLPEHWNIVHLRTGLNLVFGNREIIRPLPPM